jgi:hypothetical protein
MAQYVKATDFSVKDGLLPGDPAKIVKGTEIDDEFDAISAAIQTKADLASPTFSGTPAAPTASPGTNTTQIATTAFVELAKTAILQSIYPVGSVYANATDSTNPGTLLGFGTWTAFGAGRVMVGFNASDPLFDSAEETGGSKDAIVVSHTHTATSTSTVTDPGHTHEVLGGSAGSYQPGGGYGASFGTNGNDAGDTGSRTTGITVATSTTVASTGSSGTNANLQPYITCYFWKRVS